MVEDDDSQRGDYSTSVIRSSMLMSENSQSPFGLANYQKELVQTKAEKLIKDANKTVMFYQIQQKGLENTEQHKTEHFEKIEKQVLNHTV